MEAFVTCVKGLEEISLLELKEVLGVEGEKICPGRIIFKVKDKEELARFAYTTRSCFGVYELFSQIAFSNFEELQDQLKKLKLPEIPEPFKVVCAREGKHSFSSQDLEQAFGGSIHEQGKEVNLDNPKSIIFVDIKDNTCLVGLDYAGFKLYKRDYRIKTHQGSINPCISYTLVRLSGWKEEETLLDPFAKSGDIPIEAALFALGVANGFHEKEKFLFNNFLELKENDKIEKKKLNVYCVDGIHGNVRNAEINAKLAEVEKTIKFSRMEVDWLETKFDGGSVDKIVTVLPFVTRGLKKEEALKLYTEFFYQARYLLHLEGNITLLTLSPELAEKAAEKEEFKLMNELKPDHGQEKYSIRTYKKTI